MYEFLDRLITVALPRVRDFRGVSGKGFDGRGNYNMGVKEQIIFPEIEYDKIDALRGMNITITTTAKTDAEARRCSPRSSFRSRTEAVMAKLSLINREQKRAKLVAKFAKKRAALHVHHRQFEGLRRGQVRGQARSCRRCRATPIPPACATVARSPVVRAASSASSASAATSCASSPCAARFRA